MSKCDPCNHTCTCIPSDGKRFAGSFGEEGKKLLLFAEKKLNRNVVFRKKISKRKNREYVTPYAMMYFCIYI